MKLRAEGVNKYFRSRGETLTALRDINLTIAAGEFVCLIGPSGCGKSTLLRLIGDLTSPTTGHVTVNGGGGFGIEAPFGGVKQSGFGREGGWESILQYSRVKNVWINL